mmetsp:Transcript_23774/g.60645  ORF Transcript_23774/g.60645 Transcript_23774/m.60645 type:complete len:82 (+) Transcript_23774:89-334(+)
MSFIAVLISSTQLPVASYGAFLATAQLSLRSLSISLHTTNQRSKVLLQARRWPALVAAVQHSSGVWGEQVKVNQAGGLFTA